MYRPRSPTSIRVYYWQILTQTTPSSSISSSAEKGTNMQIRRLYEQKKNFDKITKESQEVYNILLSHGNKRSRTQVNAIEDDSEEEEQENGEQAAVHLVEYDTSRQQKDKRSKMDQVPMQPFPNPPAVWSCLGNGCPLEKCQGFLTKRGPLSG